jgi:hypothetical protein
LWSLKGKKTLKCGRKKKEAKCKPNSQIIAIQSTLTSKPRRSLDQVVLVSSNILFMCNVGYVFEAEDPNTGEKVAIKRTSKSGEYVSREFEVLDRLKGCKHVV